MWKMKGDKVFNFIIANVQTIDEIKLAARSLRKKQTTANMMELVFVWSFRDIIYYKNNETYLTNRIGNSEKKGKIDPQKTSIISPNIKLSALRIYLSFRIE